MHICECSWPIKSGNKQRQIQQQKGEKERKKRTCRKETFHKSSVPGSAPTPTTTCCAPLTPLSSLLSSLSRLHSACLAYWPKVKCQRQLQLSSTSSSLLLLGLCFMRPPLLWLKAKPSAGTKPQQRRAKRKMNCRKKKKALQK